MRIPIWRTKTTATAVNITAIGMRKTCNPVLKMLTVDPGLVGNTGNKSNRKRRDRVEQSIPSRRAGRNLANNADNGPRTAKAKEKKGKDRQLLHRDNYKT